MRERAAIKTWIEHGASLLAVARDVAADQPVVDRSLSSISQA